MSKKKKTPKPAPQDWIRLIIRWGLRPLAIVFLVFVVIALLSTLFVKQPPTSQPAHQVETKVIQHNIDRVIRQYRDSHEGKSDLKWWMSTDDIPDEAAVALEEQLIAESQHIEKLLKKYRDVSGETKKAYSRFNRVFPTIYTIINDSSITMVTTSRWSKRPRDTKIPWKLTEGEFFCMFAPRGNTGSARAAMKDFFSCSTGLKVVMLCCAVYPDPIYASGIYHELVHLSSNKPSPKGQEYDAEDEILAHEASADVLNAALDGRYFPVIDHLITRYQAPSWRQMTEKIRVEDLQKLDKVLGLENGGTDLGKMALGNHLITLGFRFIDKRGEKDKRKQKEDYYAWFRNQKY